MQLSCYAQVLFKLELKRWLLLTTDLLEGFESNLNLSFFLSFFLILFSRFRVLISCGLMFRWYGKCRLSHLNLFSFFLFNFLHVSLKIEQINKDMLRRLFICKLFFVIFISMRRYFHIFTGSTLTQRVNWHFHYIVEISIKSKKINKMHKMFIYKYKYSFFNSFVSITFSKISIVIDILSHF